MPAELALNAASSLCELWAAIGVDLGHDKSQSASPVATILGVLFDLRIVGWRGRRGPKARKCGVRNQRHLKEQSDVRKPRHAHRRQGRLRQSMPSFGQFRAISADFGAILAQFGPDVWPFSRCRANLGQHRLRLGQVLPISAEFGPMSVKRSGRSTVDIERVGPNSARCLHGLGGIWAGSVACGQSRASAKVVHGGAPFAACVLVFNLPAGQVSRWMRWLWLGALVAARHCEGHRLKMA